jgi:hypothetical protein
MKSISNPLAYIVRFFLFLSKNALGDFVGYLALKFFLFLNVSRLQRPEKPRLFWGPVPILNNKYWSNSLKDEYETKTIMNGFYSAINSKSDFDLYIDDVLVKFKYWPFAIKFRFRDFFLTYYILKNFDIYHIPFSGAFLGETRFWKKEAKLFQRFNKKTVVIPYGADAYMYSRVKNESFQNALLISYPHLARIEERITERVRYWEKHADFLNGGFMIDGMARWDALVGNYVMVDTNKISACIKYSEADGISETVNIVHSPNHRGAKGTEFLISAVDKLKEEGLKINLILIEKKQNSEVIEIFRTSADILVEQLIFGYGLNAAEGMASAIPVVSNLSIDDYTRPYRRYSYLNECPIVTSTPENITDNLRILIKNPSLRKTLGLAGRKYAEKYHSENFARFLFTNIYRKIWDGKEAELTNIFHPLNLNSYNNLSPKIEHPLFENTIPSALMEKLNK